MGHRCPYCFTDTESRRGLHSHMMQKKTCRERMEADAYISESASETAGANKQNNSNLPTQHPNEADAENPASDNEMDFDELPFHSSSPITDVQVAAAASPRVSPAASPQQPSSPNHLEDADNDNEHAEADDDTESRWIEDFPYPAGVPIGEGVSRFEEWRRDQENKNEPPWSPFKSREEWELAKWLITSGISQKKIDAFLELKTVRLSQNIMNKLLTIEI